MYTQSDLKKCHMAAGEKDSKDASERDADAITANKRNK
jgi:hypothetical protein